MNTAHKTKTDAKRDTALPDRLMTYYAYVLPENLVTWAVTAMKNSYSPYSHRREGVLIRTESGDISVGTNVETINYDGLDAIEVAIGQLFVRQPWADFRNRPEKIADIVYALDAFDPKDPDSFVPNGSSLDWLRKFGSPDTILHFATPDHGIRISKTLHELLPHGPRMKALADYLDNTSGFNKHLSTHRTIPSDVPVGVWHGLRKSRLLAFAPYSTYRVSAVLEADPIPFPDESLRELKKGFKKAGMSALQQAASLSYIRSKMESFPGMNVEVSGNAALHAEACAIGGMVTTLGPQAKISNLYLQGGFEHGVDGCTPCGKCRQLINEFAATNSKIITVSEDRAMPVIAERDLLPATFMKLE